MKLRSALKIIASAALLLNIVAAILLYGSIRNSQAAANQSFLLTYLCLFGIILFSFILYLLFMGTESGNEEKNSDGIVSAEVKEEVIIQESKDASEKLIDLEDLKKKAEGFIPGKAMDPQQKFSYKNFAEESLSQIAKIFPITEGIFYLRELGSDEFTPKGDYAYFSDKVPSGFKLGETLPGQAAKNKRSMNISDIPADYLKVASGLGQGSPQHLYFLPLVNNDEAIAVIELASFKQFDRETEKLFELGASELAAALVNVQTRNL